MNNMHKYAILRIELPLFVICRKMKNKTLNGKTTSAPDSGSSVSASNTRPLMCSCYAQNEGEDTIDEFFFIFCMV